LSVDYARSEGVIGARRVNGGLYVSLDSANQTPLIALRRGNPVQPAQPVLDNARWEIWNLAPTNGALSFTARGFGPGQMTWRTQPNQSWRIESSYGGENHTIEAQSDGEGVLTFALPRGAETPVEVRMTRGNAG
jgi:hypothetical protein